MAACDAAENEPLVTPAQREYIMLSRAAEDAEQVRIAEQERRTRELEMQTKAAAAENRRLAKRTRRAVIATIIAAIIGTAAGIVGLLSANTANIAQNNASTAEAGAATANAQANAIATQIVNATATLGAVNAEAQHQRTLNETLRLTNAANAILGKDGNSETAALLAIRALNTAYSPEADVVLQEAVNRLYTIQIFRGHTAGVNSMAFSPDGTAALTGSWDGTARLWDMDYHNFVNYACTRVFRDLTEEERRMYSITDSTPTCPSLSPGF